MKSEEIARLANVSRSTVSRVVNNYPNVPESTRLKVQAVIDEYGYTPNASARTLAGKTNNILGIFLADISERESAGRWMGVKSPYNIEILSHFIEIAKSKGYQTLVNTIDDLDECEEIERYFKNRLLHGGIFIGFPYRTKKLCEMSKKGYNVVLIDQLTDEDEGVHKIKRVNTDNVKGSYLATEYLIENGHRDLLHVSGDSRLSSISRIEGFSQAVKDYNIKNSNVISGMFCENISYDVTKEYLRHHKPTGVFVANDIMALGVIRAIRERGLRIPEDVSIVGYDNLNLWDHMKVDLTSVNVSKRGLAESAIHLLLSDEMYANCTPTIVKRSSVQQLNNT